MLGVVVLAGKKTPEAAFFGSRVLAWLGGLGLHCLGFRLGLFVGEDVVGRSVGLNVVGWRVGKVGLEVVGAFDGLGVGDKVEGELVGAELVGFGVGFEVVGSRCDIEFKKSCSIRNIFSK